MDHLYLSSYTMENMTPQIADSTHKYKLGTLHTITQHLLILSLKYFYQVY